MSSFNPYAQWLDRFGKCCCGKAAAGKLMSHVNASLGNRCEACANREIKAAHKKGQFMPDAVLKD